MPLFTKNIAKTSISSRSSDLSSLSSSLLGNPNAIRVVTSKDYKLAAACLVDAFSKDEVSGYFTNCQDTIGWSEERKWNLHVQIMNAMTYAHVKFGAVRAIGDGSGGTYDAVALWMPPGTDMDSYVAMLKNGVLWKGIQTFRMLSKEGRQRFFKEFFSLLSLTKAEILKERDPTSWYLVYLGTHSRARGKGLAKKLVTEVTKQVRSPFVGYGQDIDFVYQADSENRACYLESSNIVNVPIYQKMGFNVCKQISLQRGEEKVFLDIMVREPQLAESSNIVTRTNTEDVVQLQAIQV